MAKFTNKYKHVSLSLEVPDIQQFLDTAVNKQEFGIMVANSYYKAMQEYIPYLEGVLSQTVEIKPFIVEFLQEYAARQYYGETFNFTKEFHPLATAFWARVAWENKGDELLKEWKAWIVTNGRTQ